MLIPLLEITTNATASQVKHLQFSYPLNDRSLANALSEAYNKLDPEAAVHSQTIIDLINDGFEIAKMTCGTHTEVRYEDNNIKVIGFVDVPYHQASSNAIRNTNLQLDGIISKGYSTCGGRRVSHGNLNQDPKSLLSAPSKWFNYKFWDLRETRSTLMSDEAVVFTLPDSERCTVLNIHLGITEEDPTFIILKKLPKSYRTRELAGVYCRWHREHMTSGSAPTDSFTYADLYSKIPHAQTCNKKLVQSIRHYSKDAAGNVLVDRYTVEGFDFKDEHTRVYGWYLSGNDLSVRYMYQDKFRIDQIFLPDYYSEIFTNYTFNLANFVEKVVLDKLSKRELRQWLSDHKDQPIGDDVPYFRCVYSYLEKMIDQVRIGERQIYSRDYRMIRWLVHFGFITKDLVVLERGFKYCVDHYDTFTGL